MTRRDPVETRSTDGRDLYDISTWEPRTALDRLAVRVHRGAIRLARAVFVLIGVGILLAQVVLGGIGATFARDPYAIGLVVLSVVPALALVAYVYAADVTTPEPIGLLVGTFVLGVVFAGFAAILNSLLGPLRAIPLVGFVLFFYLVVAPVEETVKLLAVRLLPYRDASFDAVLDGAVYGATAGLGFATIENALYITRNLGGGEQAVAAVGLGAVAVPGVAVGIERLIGNIIGAGGGITAVRALAGPGHVIYSAFAGYYLGLAKFNPGRAGPIAVKGLLVAAFIHATYNTLVSVVPGIVLAFVPGVSQLVVFFGFVLVYDGVFGLLLFRKIVRYRRAYRDVTDAGDPDGTDLSPERTEFDA
jgi:RsiW-degrading membrane proteinase PrsW (M82 family)